MDEACRKVFTHLKLTHEKIEILEDAAAPFSRNSDTYNGQKHTMLIAQATEVLNNTIEASHGVNIASNIQVPL